MEIIPSYPPQKPVAVVEPNPSRNQTITPDIKDKKTKDHKKEKKDKIKKKNKKDKVKEKSEKKKLKELKKDNKEKIKKEKKEKKKEKEIREGESPIPKMLLKVNSPSPRPETPESSRKLNIKPIIKKVEEPLPEETKRETSPVGLAKISALVTGPPKPKNTPPPVPSMPEKPIIEEAPPVPAPRPPGRPRLHPLKPKPQPKPKKVEQTFKRTDDQGNEVWICPACGQQDDGRPMIGCDGCDAWYHWVCVGIQVPPDENENWYCKPCLCKKNEDLQTDKKKRRKKKEKKEH
ncbi:hypothetical protein NQ317_007460 [Molorchus minor]|uniref:PHD-type domain-containing protein n=1 Tax=Molorchus minor TaxID=1323400 RepID=A0ABQ9K0W4_9CUCU|nr:hypothetical protein NQ317_007460 [Molorchus minor]